MPFQRFNFRGAILLTLSLCSGYTGASQLLFPEQTAAYQDKLVTDPTEYASQYLVSHDIPGVVVLESEQHSLLASHYTFRQTIQGVPVHNGELVISLGPDQHVIKLYDNLTTSPSAQWQSQPLSREQAKDIAWSALRVHGKLLAFPKARLMMHQNKQGQLVATYTVSIATKAPHGFWEVTIDAHDGSIQSMHNRVIARKLRRDMNPPQYQGKILNRKLAEHQFLKERRQQRLIQKITAPSYVSGFANVFDLNPNTALQDDELHDSSPGAAFQAAYRQVVLPEITFRAGAYHLEGPWCKIIDFDPPRTAPSQQKDGHWAAERGSNAFNDATVFFHIDQSQRYIQSLGFRGDKGIQYGAIEVDTDGADGYDNSYFIPGLNRIAYGHGGITDSEDQEVILHEYGHAIESSINPYWDGGDTGAIGEAFGDYWAAAYRLRQQQAPYFHLNWVFVWDGHNEYWPGRVLNATMLKYQPGRIYQAHMPLERGYVTDELFSAPIFQALLQLREQGVTQDAVDRVILEAHFGLASEVTMPQMANSIIFTAHRLYPDSRIAQVFSTAFKAQNII